MQSSLFLQCQLYKPELSEPISLIEFTSQDVQNKLSLEQLSNSLSQISDHKPKQSLQNDKINPYKSNWANTLLNKHYKVEVTCKGSKWIIKKVTEDEPSKLMVSCLPNLPKTIQSQGKLFSNTASKYTKKRLNKFIIDQHRQYALTPNETPPQKNSSLPNLNTYKIDNNNHVSNKINHQNNNNNNNNNTHTHNNNNISKKNIQIKLNDNYKFFYKFLYLRKLLEFKENIYQSPITLAATIFQLRLIIFSVYKKLLLIIIIADYL